MSKRKKESIPSKILGLNSFLKKPRSGEEIRKELKDVSGYNINITEVRRSLLRLLRKNKVKRKLYGKVYKYYIGSGNY